MFNSKLHHFLANNQPYINTSYSAPYASQVGIHDCTTPFQGYKNTKGLLQTWGDKNAAVERFAMRPITNPKEYFNNIKEYLSNLVISERQSLIGTEMTKERYTPFLDTGDEPLSSFINMLNVDVTDYLNIKMVNSGNEIPMFNSYNPLSEGFVITDIKINTYKSLTNNNHFYNTVLFSVVNTTRYNTITFKAEVYQNTTRIIDAWNKSIKEHNNNNNDLHSDIYIYNIMLATDTNNFNSLEGFSLRENLPFTPATVISTGGTNSVGNIHSGAQVQEIYNKILLSENGLSNNIYDNEGNPYGLGSPTVGTIGTIYDNGPSGIDKLIKELGY